MQYCHVNIYFISINNLSTAVENHVDKYLTVPECRFLKPVYSIGNYQHEDHVDNLNAST